MREPRISPFTEDLSRLGATCAARRDNGGRGFLFARSVLSGPSSAGQGILPAGALSSGQPCPGIVNFLDELTPVLLGGRTQACHSADGGPMTLTACKSRETGDSHALPYRVGRLMTDARHGRNLPPEQGRSTCSNP